MLSIFLIFISLIIFITGVAGGSINANVVLIISSVVISIIILPLVCFFLFHIFLVCTGRTTRELIKTPDHKFVKGFNWCQTDAPLV
jgi:hypothetical protein